MESPWSPYYPSVLISTTCHPNPETRHLDKSMLSGSPQGRDAKFNGTTSYQQRQRSTNSVLTGFRFMSAPS